MHGVPMKLEGPQSLEEVYASYICLVIPLLARLEAVAGSKVAIDIPDVEERIEQGAPVTR